MGVVKMIVQRFTEELDQNLILNFNDFEDEANV